MSQIMPWQEQNITRGMEINRPIQSLNYYTSDNTESEVAIKNAGLINWTFDSGSSYHMTNDLNSLENVVKHKETISFADGGKVIATHKVSR